MAEQTPPPQRPDTPEHDDVERVERPVLKGIVALVGVALVVGLVLGGGALAATRVLGIGGGDDVATDASTERDQLDLPSPEPTEGPSEPLLTLRPGDSESAEPSASPTESEEPETEIALSAGQTQVSSMGQIDLTGTYTGGEGAILQVERFQDGAWVEFPVTASVSNETFTTYVQTGQTGVNRFRMADTDSDEVSNEVRVTVG